MNLTLNDRERLAYIDGDANTLALIDQIELERDLRSCRAVSTNELSRPWKLATLAAGLGLLIAGSFYYEAPDWDIPISIVMALVAYVTAPWSLRVMVERRWRSWPLMILTTWFGVDGCYWLYWSWKDPVALELMRDANAPASLSVYWMCGLLWYWRGSLGEAMSQALASARGLGLRHQMESRCLSSKAAHPFHRHALPWRREK